MNNQKHRTISISKNWKGWKLIYDSSVEIIIIDYN